MASIIDLLKAPDRVALQTKLFELLRLSGFPTPSWHRFSLLRHSAENEPLLVEDLWERATEIAKGGFVSLAEGAWLDLAAENFFDEVRKPSLATVGKLVLSDPNSVGPTSVTPNAITVSTPDQLLRFVVTSSGTVPAGGSLTVDVRAESTGARFNVPNGTIDTLVTSLPGIVVSNPAQPSSGTWITTQGADAESDGELADRLISKWGTLGSGSNDSSYRYYALNAANEIRRCLAYSPTPGSVRVVVGGVSGPVSSGALALAVAAVEGMRPLAVSVATVNAIANVVTIVASLDMAPGFDGAAAQSQAIANVASYAASLDIGAKVSYEKIVQALVSPTGVRDITVTVNGDIDDVLPSSTEEIFVPSLTVTLA
jgi:uncharacterized phage protein gp47/JayE